MADATFEKTVMAAADTAADKLSIRLDTDILRSSEPVKDIIHGESGRGAMRPHKQHYHGNGVAGFAL
jgi:hypothetical protein